MVKKTRRSPAPKKCIQTVCGNTCIKKGYRCKDDDPKAQSNIKRKTSDLKRTVDKEVEAAFKTGRAKQAESVIKNLTKKRSKSETMKRGSAILEKYGTPSDSRADVDRVVEAGTRTRRKPMTESEKTAKVLKREQAQRVIRELQQEEKPPKFNFNKLVGEGMYGEVFLDEKRGVVKKTLLSELERFTKEELEVGFKMGEAGYSPKVYKDLSNSKEIVMELVEGKTIGYQEKYSLEQSKQILRAVTYLHKNLGYRHGDLHQGNILVNDKDAKIIDYGTAKKIDKDDDRFRAFDDFRYLYKFLDREGLKKEPEFKQIMTMVDKYGQYMPIEMRYNKEQIVKEYTDWLKS